MSRQHSNIPLFHYSFCLAIAGCTDLHLLPHASASIRVRAGASLSKFATLWEVRAKAFASAAAFHFRYLHGELTPLYFFRKR